MIEALGAGPVDVFASSGGAITALALVAAYPDRRGTLVAHEPPVIPVVPDAAQAERARAAVRDVYEAGGWGAGMAAFMLMTAWRGEYTEDYFAQPPADPGRVWDADRRRRPARRPAPLRPLMGRQQLPPRPRGASRGVNARRDRRGGGVRGRLHRTYIGGHRRSARPAGHGLPKSPRRLLGPEFGYPGQPEAFAQAPRCPRRLLSGPGSSAPCPAEAPRPPKRAMGHLELLAEPAKRSHPAPSARRTFPGVPSPPNRYLMNRISAYFGSGHRSSATTFSSLSAAVRTSSIAGITVSRMYLACFEHVVVRLVLVEVGRLERLDRMRRTRRSGPRSRSRARTAAPRAAARGAAPPPAAASSARSRPRSRTRC